MKTIVVATDFSPVALNAARYATEMAMSINAEILLLHVCQLPVTYGEAPAVINEGDMIQDAEKDLYQLSQQLSIKTNNKITISTEVSWGLFLHELKNVCERVNPYAVIMGCQGTTAADHLLQGSHAVQAVKHLSWPVITVPPGAGFSTIKKIALACDFNRVADTIPLDEIKILVHDFNATLYVLNTGNQISFDSGIMDEFAVLKKMLTGLDPVYEFIAGENIDEGILDYAEKNNIGLLLVLPKRRNLLDNIFHKSHTKNMVLHSHVPVMVLHH